MPRSKEQVLVSTLIEITDLGEVEFKGMAVWENRGAGRTEFWGAVTFDTNWQFCVEDFFYDEGKYTSDQNFKIKDFADRHEEFICTQLEKEANEN